MYISISQEPPDPKDMAQPVENNPFADDTENEEIVEEEVKKPIRALPVPLAKRQKVEVKQEVKQEMTTDELNHFVKQALVSWLHMFQFFHFVQFLLPASIQAKLQATADSQGEVPQQWSKDFQATQVQAVSWIKTKHKCTISNISL